MNDLNKVILSIAIIILLIIIGIYYYMRLGNNQNIYATPTPSARSTPASTPDITRSPTPTPSPTRASSPSSAPTRTPALSPTSTPTVTPAPITYNIAATEFKYTPDTITAKPGQMIKIVFLNSGNTQHNITFENIGKSTQTISSGQTDTIQFAAPAAGTYTFFCSIDNHRNLGLTGKLIVR